MSIIENYDEVEMALDKYRYYTKVTNTFYFKDYNDTVDNYYPFFIDSNLDIKTTWIDIYNKNSIEPMQKIWVLTEKVKVFNLLKINNKLSSLIILFTSNEKNNSLFNFIKKSEKKIIQKLNKQIEICSSIRIIDDYMTLMIVNIPDNLIMFNDDNNLTKNIQINDTIQLYLELNSLWFDDNKLGLNWNILQLKIYNKFNFNKCLFGEPKNIIKTIKTPEIVNEIIENKKVIKNNYKPRVELTQNYKNQPKIKVHQFKFAPTLKQITEMKNKLNKTNIILI